MYTKLDDIRQSKFIQKYIKEHPHDCIKDIVQNCVVTRRRLLQLKTEGLISLPEPLALGVRNKRWRENQAV
jgi:hypothetical protein